APHARRRQPARLHADPGGRARRRGRLRARQPRGRRRLLAAQPAHPRLGGVAMNAAAIAVRSPRARRRRLLARRFLRRPLAVTGLLVALAFVLAAIFAPYVAPYDPDATDFGAVLAH